MVEASAYGGFKLAIGYCHLHGLGKFVKDEKKGYNISNKYITNNEDDRLAQYLMGRVYYYGYGVGGADGRAENQMWIGRPPTNHPWFDHSDYLSSVEVGLSNPLRDMTLWNHDADWDYRKTFVSGCFQPMGPSIHDGQQRVCKQSIC